MEEADIKERLMKTDQEFQKLALKHQEYERQLQDYLQKPYLTEQEQLEETTLKKKKLAIKDQMQIIISRHQTSAMH